jgi:hypothetical protein
MTYGSRAIIEAELLLQRLATRVARKPMTEEQAEAFVAHWVSLDTETLSLEDRRKQACVRQIDERRRARVR